MTSWCTTLLSSNSRDAGYLHTCLCEFLVGIHVMYRSILLLCHHIACTKWDSPLQTLYKTQVKELREEVDEKTKHLLETSKELRQMSEDRWANFKQQHRPRRALSDRKPGNRGQSVWLKERKNKISVNPRKAPAKLLESALSKPKRPKPLISPLPSPK